MSALGVGKPRTLSKLGQSALDIVILAKRRGQSDMTLAEILHAVRAQAGWEAAEKSSLSRELTDLAKDGLLLIRPVKRKSAWEALPRGAKQHSWPASSAYYAPGARPVAAGHLISASAADCY